VCLITYFIIINTIDNKPEINNAQLINCSPGNQKQVDSLKNQLLLAEKNKDSKKMINTCVILGNCFHQHYNYKNSLIYFLKAYEHKSEINQYHLIADITYKIALDYLELGDFVKAHEFALKTDSVERIHQKINAETLNLLGSIYEKSGLFVKSLNTLHQSLELQKEEENIIGLANSYYNVAHIYMQTEKYELAYEYYSNALGIYKNLESDIPDLIENQINTAKIYLSLGNYYNMQNDTTNAIGYLNKAIDIFDKAKNSLYNAQVMFSMGNIYFKSRNFEEAEKYYSKALEINYKESDKTGLIIANLNLAKLYHYQNKKDKKVEALKAALNLANKVGAKSKLAEAVELLYFEYAAFPDSVEQAMEYATLFLKTKKYLPNSMMQDSIIQMSARHEVTLQKNEELSNEKYKKNLRTILLLFALVLSMIVFSFIYYRNRVKQHQIYEEKLREEQKFRFREVVEAIEGERKRIAVDLHDSLGQMLSITKLYLSSLEEVEGLQEDNNKSMYNNIITMIDDSRGELRNISFNIMPGSFIKYGLIVAIDELSNRINDSDQIKMIFNHEGFEERQNENFEIIIYRIIQEAINNVIKHANASTVHLKLMVNGNICQLIIKDDGMGMEGFEQYKGVGMGWKSIYSRVEMLNGTIKVNTTINKGTEISITLPV